MFLYNNHFCLLWKLEHVSFIQAIKELKDDFEIGDDYSHFEYIFQPKKTQYHLTNFIVYDLETPATDKARPYVFFHRLSKLAGRYHRVFTHDEIQNCKKDTFALDGDSCVEKPLDFCLKRKGQERKDSKNKFPEYSFQFNAHNGSGFDTWFVLNNLLCDKKIVNIVKNGKSFIEEKLFNGLVGKNGKQIP